MKKLVNRWNYSTGFFWTWVLYGCHVVKEISIRMLKSTWWKCSRDLSLYNLHSILLCIYFTGRTGVLPIPMQDLVHELTEGTSQDTVAAELQSPLQSPWSIITRDDSRAPGSAVFPLHGVTEALQTLRGAAVEAPASACRLIQANCEGKSSHGSFSFHLHWVYTRVRHSGTRRKNYTSTRKNTN